jgi:hypothetical protein
MWNNNKLVTNGKQRRTQREYSLPESFVSEWICETEVERGESETSCALLWNAETLRGTERVDRWKETVDGQESRDGEMNWSFVLFLSHKPFLKDEDLSFAREPFLPCLFLFFFFLSFNKKTSICLVSYYLLLIIY